MNIKPQSFVGVVTAGAAVGVVIGFVSGNLALWLAVGVGCGLALATGTGAVRPASRGNNDARR
ncbi:MAG TPA: hypothetical protein PKA27_11320 [Fimbriimonadaceae bacterium]|nr:hypothetical protein [Fimbriimonadaceae bacterium]